MGGVAGGEDLCGEGVVGAEEGGQVGAECHAGGTGEGRGVDQEVRAGVGGFGQEVAEEEAAFGVGVADLDGESAAGAEDVEGAHGAAGDHVLDAGDSDVEADGEVGFHDDGGEAEHEGCAAHVFFHAEHGGGWFEVVAAAVEADAFAAEGDQGRVGFGLATGPGEAGDDGGAVGAGADGGDGRVFAGEGFAFDEGGWGVKAGGDGLDGLGEFGRAEVVGGRVHEIADEPGCAGHCECGGGRVAGEAGGGAFGSGVGGELVCAEAEAEDGVLHVEIAGLEGPGGFGGEGHGEGAVGEGGSVGAQAEQGAGDALGAWQKDELGCGCGESGGFGVGGLVRGERGEAGGERVLPP